MSKLSVALLRILLGGLLGFTIVTFGANSAKQKCDYSGGTIFVIDSMQQIQINRRADVLLSQGDSVTGYMLKRVLMSQQ